MFTYIAKNGRTYHLVMASVTLRGGKEATVYFFKSADAKLQKGTHYAKELPEDREIVDNGNFPLIKKSRN